MGLPFKSSAVLSAAITYILLEYKPNLLFFSQPSYLGTFFQIWSIVVGAWITWEVVLYPNFFSPLRNLPGPAGATWWGGHYNITSKDVSGGPMVDWVNNIPNDGIIRYLGLLNWENLLIVSPKGLSEVLTTKASDFIKPLHFTAGLGRILGIGILLAEGDVHKIQRKNLLPAFAYRHIKDLYPVFWDKSIEIVAALTKQVKTDSAEKGKLGEWDASFEVGEWSSRVTLDIIGIASMGYDFGSVRDPDAELSRTYKKVLQTSKQAQILGILSLFLPTWLVHSLPVKRNGEEDEAAKIVRATCKKIIQAKKEKLEKRELVDVDILSVALESGCFTDDNLVDQLMTFLVAGHETTATAMIWGIYLLCLHPEIQTRLRAEIRENLPSLDSGTPITSHQIDSMTYLSAVCNEVLRYYPPVPLIPRIAAHDTTILGNFVPKGTRVMLCPWATNRDATLWGDDAAKFNPERWMPSPTNPNHASGGTASNYAFLTFLHGPRSCIGQSFAKAEFACLLAAWVGRFEYTLLHERDFDEQNVLNKTGTTAKPAKGLFVKARVVEGW